MKMIRRFFLLYFATVVAMFGIACLTLRGILILKMDGDPIPLLIATAGIALFAFVMHGMHNCLKSYFKLRESLEMNAFMSVLPRPAK